MSSGCGVQPLRSLELVVCTTVWGGLFAFCEFLYRVCRLSPSSWGPPNIILTSLLSGVWLAFPYNLGVFCLHGRVLLATGLMFACSLTTTLDFVVRCNTPIRSEFVYCALVAYNVKYVCLLAITLDIAVCYNTTTRLESVCCALMTCGQVFVCYSVKTLGITIRCDIAIRPKSVCCVLEVIRLLPICCAHLR